LDFPNLPYLIDGDYNVTESSAIQRYIIKRWGNSDLLGKNIHDNAEVERFLSVFSEVSSAIKGLYWNKEWETAKVAVLEKYAVKLDQLNKFVGEKNFVLGYVTLADFVVAEDSYYIEKVFPAEYQANGFLQKIRENFNKLPEVVAYYEKPTAFKGIFFPPTAAIQIDNPFAEKKEA
jgi:glutathione S-transferase